MGCRGNQMKKDDKFGMIEILENATIIYKDTEREIFEAIFITDSRDIIFGQILSNDSQDLFVECGGIPKDNIKSIEGGTKKMAYKKIFKI